jgi:hypothetical protein
VVAVDRDAVRGGRIDRRHTRLAPRRLTPITGGSMISSVPTCCRDPARFIQIGSTTSFIVGAGDPTYRRAATDLLPLAGQLRDVVGRADSISFRFADHTGQLAAYRGLMRGRSKAGTRQHHAVAAMPAFQLVRGRIGRSDPAIAVAYGGRHRPSTGVAWHRCLRRHRCAAHSQPHPLHIPSLITPVFLLGTLTVLFRSPRWRRSVVRASLACFCMRSLRPGARPRRLDTGDDTTPTPVSRSMLMAARRLSIGVRDTS